MKSKSPSPNGSNGKRDASGRFAAGNPGGPGNPYARQVAQLRAVILDAVTEDDLKAIVAGLIERAKDGDLAAAQELFNRLLGKPPAGVDPRVDDRAERQMKLTEGQFKLDEEMHEEKLWDF